MLPKPIRDLRGEEARRFMEIDARPISRKEVEATKRSVHAYHAIKPRRK